MLFPAPLYVCRPLSGPLWNKLTHQCMDALLPPMSGDGRGPTSTLASTIQLSRKCNAYDLLFFFQAREQPIPSCIFAGLKLRCLLV